MAQEERFAVPVGGSGSVTVARSLPQNASRFVFLYAPGAGSNIDDAFGVYCSQRLADFGVQTWRLQFPYMEAGRKAPDRPAALESTWWSVMAAALRAGPPLVIGGRSMGGRIASQVAAQKAGVAALVLFAYPLHPPGKPEQRRDEHLPSIEVPALFCSGTRDAFASQQELIEAADLVPDSSLHFLEGADHGFNVLKSSGRSRRDVWEEAVMALTNFLETRSADREDRQP